MMLRVTALCGDVVMQRLIPDLTCALALVVDHELACRHGYQRMLTGLLLTLQVSTYIREHFGFEYRLRGWIILILLAYVVVFRLCAILGVTKLTFVRR